jgi:hypothetical protein
METVDIGKTLDNLFNQSRQQPIDSEPKLPPVSPEQFEGYLNRLWVVMMETWGHKWISAMGEEPTDTWREGLKPLSIEDWLRAITMVRASKADWPPSLPEFKRWSYGEMSEAEAKAQAIDEWNSLPPKKYNPFVTPQSYDQIEIERRNFIQSKVSGVSMEEVNRRRVLNHQEPITDPRRICQDEGYN